MHKQALRWSRTTQNVLFLQSRHHVGWWEGESLFASDALKVVITDRQHIGTGELEYIAKVIACGVEAVNGVLDADVRSSISSSDRAGFSDCGRVRRRVHGNDRMWRRSRLRLPPPRLGWALRRHLLLLDAVVRQSCHTGISDRDGPALMCTPGEVVGMGSADGALAVRRAGKYMVQDRGHCPKEDTPGGLTRVAVTGGFSLVTAASLLRAAGCSVRARVSSRRGLAHLV